MEELITFLGLQKAEILLVLDYDGTLTEIVTDPMDATLSYERKKIIETLASKEHVTVLINSGRPIEELLEVTNNIEVDLLGNHGLFFYNCSTKNIELTLDSKKLDLWDKKLQEFQTLVKTNLIPKYPNLWLQENKHGFVLHTRTMNPAIKNLFLLEFESLLKTKYKDVTYSTGKEIIEIKPSKLINKGKGIDWYLHNRMVFKGKNYKILVVGDDITDEDMFKLINKRKNGISIRIGEKELSNSTDLTSAKIIIKSVEEFHTFLVGLCNEI